MYCTQCGAKLTEGLKFCTSCGSRIKAGQQPAPPSPEVVPTSPPDPVIDSQPTTATEPMAGEIEEAASQPGTETDLRSVTASPPSPSTQEEPTTSAPETQPGAAPTTTAAPSGQSSSEALDSLTTPQQEASQGGWTPPAMTTPPPPADSTIPIPRQETPAAPRDSGAQGKRSGLPWVWITVVVMAVIAVAAGGYFGVKYFYNSAPQQTGSLASGPAGQSGPSNSAQAGQETNPNSVPTPNASEATAQPPQSEAANPPASPTAADSEQTTKPEIKPGRHPLAENQPPSAKKQEPSLGFGPTSRSAATQPGGVAPAVAPPEAAPSPQAPVPPTAAMQPVSPPVASLKADPASITEGQSSTLTWNTENATEVSIQPGVGSVPTHGSASVAPNTPTTYTLTAIGTGHSAIASAKVEVLPAGPSEGTIVWQGEIHGVSPVSIEGNHASIGTIVSGGLPGLPCTVRLEKSKGATLQTTPDKWNSWKLIVLQIRGNGRVTVRLSWSLLR
jgi:zinc-ribbon domain